VETKFFRIAPFVRRAIAHFIDLALIILVLSLLGLFLPVAPPPVDAMAFYSEQDFKNYFTLVAAWFVIATCIYLLAMFRVISCTPGMWLTGLRYVGLDGGAPTPISIGKRFIGALLYSLLILLPGPIIAVVVAMLTHAIFRTPLTTAAKMLDEIGVPDLAQLAIHSLSFMALFVGIIYVFKQLSHKDKGSSELTPSWYDRKCGCTIVVK